MIESVYIIYSADILGTDAEIDSMGPLRAPSHTYPHAAAFPGRWVQTEGDEEYGYGYLADEGGDEDYRAADDGGQGRHRKWVAELTPDDWHATADALMIDLDPNGLPEKYDDTLGSITEYGHIPAVAVDNTEGWSPTRVIDSMLYLSFALSEPELEDS
jgi:hypothetical protein